MSIFEGLFGKKKTEEKTVASDGTTSIVLTSETEGNKKGTHTASLKDENGNKRDMLKIKYNNKKKKNKSVEITSAIDGTNANAGNDLSIGVRTRKDEGKLVIDVSKTESEFLKAKDEEGRDTSSIENEAVISTYDKNGNMIGYELLWESFDTHQEELTLKNGKTKIVPITDTDYRSYKGKFDENGILTSYTDSYGGEWYTKEPDENNIDKLTLYNNEDETTIEYKNGSPVKIKRNDWGVKTTTVINQDGTSTVFDEKGKEISIKSVKETEAYLTELNNSVNPEILDMSNHIQNMSAEDKAKNAQAIEEFLSLKKEPRPRTSLAEMRAKTEERNGTAKEQTPEKAPETQKTNLDLQKVAADKKRDSYN